MSIRLLLQNLFIGNGKVIGQVRGILRALLEGFEEVTRRHLCVMGCDVMMAYKVMMVID